MREIRKGDLVRVAKDVPCCESLSESTGWYFVVEDVVPGHVSCPFCGDETETALAEFQNGARAIEVSRLLRVDPDGEQERRERGIEA
jgi:hypothetical protein